MTACHRANMPVRNTSMIQGQEREGFGSSVVSMYLNIIPFSLVCKDNHRSTPL